AIGGEDTPRLAIDPLIQWPRLTNRRTLVRPHRAFHLIIQAQLVGCDERGFRWAPGMESNLIESVRLTDPDSALPRVHVYRRITGKRKDTAFKRAAHKEGPPVDCQLRT